LNKGDYAEMVKIITDSTSDISPELAKKLGIHVVPGYIQFGKEIYRDGVDISKPGFYHKLIDYPIHPQTSEASPKDFAEIYSRYEHEAEGIVSIHISSKISRMYDAARKGKEMAKAQYDIEVIDSNFASIGLGLVVIAAAKLANVGGGIQDIVNETKIIIGQVSMFGLFDTMKYVAKGGRVTKHVMELSSIFLIKPLLTFRNGEIVADGLARTHSSGMERLFEYARDVPRIQDMSIAYSTDYSSAVALKQRLGSIFPEQRIRIEQIGAALGAHSGPDALFVAFRRAE